MAAAPHHPMDSFEYWRGSVDTALRNLQASIVAGQREREEQMNQMHDSIDVKSEALRVAIQQVQTRLEQYMSLLYKIVGIGIAVGVCLPPVISWLVLHMPK